MQVESMFTATKHQHFRKISTLRAETTTVYLNGEEGESYVCVRPGWRLASFQAIYAASFMQAREHLAEAAATRIAQMSTATCTEAASPHALAAPLRRRRVQQKKKEKPLQTSARTEPSALGKPSIA